MSTEILISTAVESQSVGGRTGENLSGFNLENHSCFGGRVIVAPLVHLLFIFFLELVKVRPSATEPTRSQKFD